MTSGQSRTGEGAVVVDIGDDVGALVVYTEPDMAGAEIEISPVGDDARRSHVAVLRRPVRGRGAVFAAVYASLPAGAYRLWGPDGSPAGPVRVAGGRVTETTWAAVRRSG